MERYIHRLLDSVLTQSYPAIEMYVIDDESTDNSVKIIEGYIEKFDAKGFSLHCIHQAHAGQSNAIKIGLQFIKGKYLVWPDADDYYACDDAISEMVATLENSSEEFKMVRTQERIVLDGSFKEVELRGITAKEEEERSLFEDCLFGKNGFFFVPGAYMLDIQALKEVSNFDIYTNPEAGQNWQLLLPVLHKYRCKTILKPYYNVVRRKESHSRMGLASFEEIERRKLTYYETQVETLKRIKEISTEQLDRYKSDLKVFYAHILFKMSISQNRRCKTKEYFEILKDYNAETQKERMLFRLSKAKWLLPVAIKIKRMCYGRD